MEEIEIFSTRIKELRESLNMTQTQFSGFIGVKQQTLSGYERGIMKPPLDIAKIIAQKCHVSIDWLCGLSEERELNPQIRNYKDLILKIFELINANIEPPFEMGAYVPEIFCHSADPPVAWALALPKASKLSMFWKTYSELNYLLQNDQIGQDTLNTWINGKLEEFEKIPINTFNTPPQE